MVAEEGRVSGEWSMSDLLRERQGSDGRQRDRLLRGQTAGATASEKRNTLSGSISITVQKQTPRVCTGSVTDGRLTFDCWPVLLFPRSLCPLQLCYNLGKGWTELCIHLKLKSKQT